MMWGARRNGPEPPTGGTLPRAATGAPSTNTGPARPGGTSRAPMRTNTAAWAPGRSAEVSRAGREGPLGAAGMKTGVMITWRLGPAGQAGRMEDTTRIQSHSLPAGGAQAVQRTEASQIQTQCLHAGEARRAEAIQIQGHSFPAGQAGRMEDTTRIQSPAGEAQAVQRMEASQIQPHCLHVGEARRTEAIQIQGHSFRNALVTLTGAVKGPGAGRAS